MQLLKGKMKKTVSAAARIFIAVYVLAVVILGCTDPFIPDRICVTKDELYSLVTDVAEGINVNGTTYEVDAKLFGKIPIKEVKVDVLPDTRLVPCGNVFGVKFFTKGVVIIKLAEIETKDGMKSPAKQAGLMEGDVIISINGTNVNTAEQMSQIVEDCRDSALDICFERDGELVSITLNPLLSLNDKKYKTGIWVRDSTAGIGTMTYYNPSTGEFAGLGHGICDVDTGLLMPMLSASVVDVEITDIVKGRKGSPGELKGSFDSIKKGSLSGNSKSGVYGFVDECPENLIHEPCEIALEDEITEGDAYILCELDDEGIQKYEISVTKIRKDDTSGKNFVIEVTDERLLDKTGGIVQGMSGSPVIQNGKLVGAVTHVLVNTPSKGYGIFIQNMLKEQNFYQNS